MAATETTSGYEILISPDRLTASVQWREESPVVGAAAVLEGLRTKGVKLTEAVQEQVQQAASDGAWGKKPMVVARGVAAVDDVAAAIVSEAGGGSESGAAARVDPRERCSFKMVGAGQALGQVRRYEKGRDGLDLFGRVLARKTASSSNVSVGKNAALAADGVTIVAQVAGCVHVEGLKVWVEPRLAVDKDVDFSTGNLKFEGDVTIGRHVLDMFHVQATGHVTIGGTVEAAVIEAGGDLTVGGGINGKEKGKCRAGGSIRGRFASNALVEGGGDVVFRTEVANSRIICRGKLTVEEGPLLGGQTTALGGVKCQAVGSASGVRTVVEAGVDDSVQVFLREVAPRVEAELKMIRKIQTEVAPLLQCQRKLSAEQKEKITEMMYEASEKETRLKEEMEQWRLRLAGVEAQGAAEADGGGGGGAEVTVQEGVYPGAVIRIGRLELTVERKLQGPMRLAARRVEHEPRIVALSESGPGVVLGGHLLGGEAMEKAKGLIMEVLGKREAKGQGGNVKDKL